MRTSHPIALLLLTLMGLLLRFLAAGMDDNITKPIRGGQLIALFAEIRPLSPAQDASP